MSFLSFFSFSRSSKLFGKKKKKREGGGRGGHLPIFAATIPSYVLDSAFEYTSTASPAPSRSSTSPFITKAAASRSTFHATAAGWFRNE